MPSSLGISPVSWLPLRALYSKRHKGLDTVRRPNRGAMPQAKDKRRPSDRKRSLTGGLAWRGCPAPWGSLPSAGWIEGSCRASSTRAWTQDTARGPNRGAMPQVKDKRRPSDRKGSLTAIAARRGCPAPWGSLPSAGCHQIGCIASITGPGHSKAAKQRSYATS